MGVMKSIKMTALKDVEVGTSVGLAWDVDRRWSHFVPVKVVSKNKKKRSVTVERITTDGVQTVQFAEMNLSISVDDIIDENNRIDDERRRSEYREKEGEANDVVDALFPQRSTTNSRRFDTIHRLSRGNRMSFPDSLQAFFDRSGSFRGLQPEPEPPMVSGIALEELVSLCSSHDDLLTLKDDMATARELLKVLWTTCDPVVWERAVDMATKKKGR